MDRRSFFAACAAVALAPVVTAADPLPPRQFHRFDRANDRWVKIRPEEIRKGDEIWIFDPPDGYSDVVLISNVDHANQQVFSAWRIDKNTNQWTNEGWVV